MGLGLLIFLSVEINFDCVELNDDVLDWIVTDSEDASSLNLNLFTML